MWGQSWGNGQTHTRAPLSPARELCAVGAAAPRCGREKSAHNEALSDVAAVPKAAGGSRGGRDEGRKEPVGPRLSLPSPPRGRGGLPGAGSRGPGEGGHRWARGPREDVEGRSHSPLILLIGQKSCLLLRSRRRKPPGSTKGPCEGNQILILALLALGGILVAK